MIIDSHVHVWSYPALFDLEDKIRTTEDLITFRTKYPDLYERTLHEEPVDNSDQLIAHMDERGIDKALVQARPGAVTNDQVAGCSIQPQGTNFFKGLAGNGAALDCWSDL